MRTVIIPIHSQPAPTPDKGHMPMPYERDRFEKPRPPAPGTGRDVAGARDVLLAFLAQFEAWPDFGVALAAEPPALDLAGLPPATLRVLNEALGEGEVAAIVDGGERLRVQETVFAGVWREQHVGPDGGLVHDFLLAAPLPPLLRARAQQAASGRLRALPLPAGAMNVPALVNELQQAMDRCAPGSAPHVLNLTLLPLSPDDRAHLDALLAGGSVVILSRGFGNCRIASTAARHVWRVQYFNTMQTPILDTLEVVAMPEVALAAAEDLAESHRRLAELLRWMSDSLPTA